MIETYLDSSTPASFAAFVFPRDANHIYLDKEDELQDVILTSCVRGSFYYNERTMGWPGFRLLRLRCCT
jgi:hypothetical protein